MQPSWNILPGRSLLTCSYRSPKFAAIIFWSEVNEIVGRHQSYKSSLCSDLSLENINDFFVLWLLQMIIALPNPIWHQLPYFVLISLNSSQSDPLMYYQSGTLTLRNLLAQMISRHSFTADC